MSQDFKPEQEKAANVLSEAAGIVGLIAWPFLGGGAALSLCILCLIGGLLYAFVLLPRELRKEQQRIEKEQQQKMEPPKPVFLFSELSETRDGL